MFAKAMGGIPDYKVILAISTNYFVLPSVSIRNFRYEPSWSSVGWSVGHNFLKGGKLHFHAPIRTLVYLTLKCPSLYSIEISPRDLVFLLLFVDLFGIYSKWQRIGAFYVPNETLGRGVCIPHTLLVCVVYDPNDTWSLSALHMIEFPTTSRTSRTYLRSPRYQYR